MRKNNSRPGNRTGNRAGGTGGAGKGRGGAGPRGGAPRGGAGARGGRSTTIPRAEYVEVEAAGRRPREDRGAERNERFERTERNDRFERGGRGDRFERDREERFSPSATGEQLEGRHPVLEALKSGRTINKILMAEGATGSNIMDIMGKARELSIVVQTVPKAKLDQISESRNHQGVIAYIAAKDYVELEDIVEAANNSPRPGLILVLDEIEDPHNLGSILRTADAVGAHGVVIPKRRAVPLTATVAKASAGAIEHIPVARVANLSQALETLKKGGFWVVGTDVDAENMYHQVDMTAPTVIVIGNEGKGLGEVIKKRCDYLVRLPMIGQIQSLNAGVAAGILMYEVLRQRGAKRS